MGEQGLSVLAWLEFGMEVVLVLIYGTRASVPHGNIVVGTDDALLRPEAPGRFPVLPPLENEISDWRGDWVDGKTKWDNVSHGAEVALEGTALEIMISIADEMKIVSEWM